MKKNSVLNVSIIFLLVLGATASQAGASVITVDTDGGANYTSIQEAVDRAQNGDIIVVFPGVYKENVKVNKELTITSNSNLTGDEFNRTYIIGAFPDSNVFSINSNNVTIEGFQISGGPSRTEKYEVGISLDRVNNCSLINNALIMNGMGILLTGAQGNYIVNNLASFGSEGISLVNSEENLLSDNLALVNGNGISLNNSMNNTLINNSAESNSIGIYMDTAAGNLLSYNFISRNDYGVLGKNSQSNSLINNSLYLNEVGVYLNRSSGNSIYENNFGNFFDAVDEGNNIWNSTSAGNYWRNYTGVDADGNGIGDTPYAVNQTTGSIDYMPLMNMTSSGSSNSENMSENPSENPMGNSSET